MFAPLRQNMMLRPMARALAPSGAPAGRYYLHAIAAPPFASEPQVLGMNANIVRTNTAQMAALFNQAARDLGINATSAGTPIFSFVAGANPDGSPLAHWTLPVNLTGAANDETLRRALARAIFWSSEFSRIMPVTGEVKSIPPPAADGGSTLMRSMTSFRVEAAPAPAPPQPAPPVVRPPTPTTPAAPPPPPSMVAEAGMGSGAILGLSLAAALGVGWVYRKSLFGSKRR